MLLDKTRDLCTPKWVLLARTGTLLSPADQADLARNVTTQQAQRESGAFEIAWIRGRAMALECWEKIVTRALTEDLGLESGRPDWTQPASCARIPWLAEGGQPWPSRRERTTPPIS